MTFISVSAGFYCIHYTCFNFTRAALKAESRNISTYIRSISAHKVDATFGRTLDERLQIQPYRYSAQCAVKIYYKVKLTSFLTGFYFA